MEQHLFELTKIAVEGQRQDEDILSLYWKFIQSQQVYSDTPVPHGDEHVLPESYRLLYTAWQEQGEHEQLHELIETACQRHFADAAVLSLMAEGEFEAKRYDNALKLYDRLLTAGNLDEKGYQQLKLACFRWQVFDDFSNLLLQRCLTRNPADISIQQYLFSQYLLNEKYTYAPAAPAIYHHILEREPDNMTARSALCEYYYRQGKYEQAIAEGEAGLHYHKHHANILATLAKAHYEQEEYGRTVTYCQNVLKRNPGRAEIQVLLAAVYARNALTTNDAMKQYQAALKFEPQYFEIRQALFRTYLRKLHVDEAVEEGEKVLAELYEIYAPEDRDLQRAIKDMIAEYEHAIRRDPGNITLYLVTAKLHEQIGHFNKALIYYRTMLQLPLNKEAIQHLIALLEQSATFQVQNPHLYLYLGLLYHTVGRSEEAKLAFREVMYQDLDEREVDEILIRHDHSIWQYTPVLVILAHHRIVTKDILDGLVLSFRYPDPEDWNGVLWVLQELYDVDDLLPELRQMFSWDTFAELYPHILPLLANNGSLEAVQLLQELLSHPHKSIRVEVLNTLIAMKQSMAEQCLVKASLENPYPDVRFQIARYYAQYPSEPSTYHLVNMLHDEDTHVRLHVVRSLQTRDIQVEHLREVLFTEQNVEVKTEIIKLFKRQDHLEEPIYLVHLLNDLVAKRYEENRPGKVYNRIRKLISYSEQPEEQQLLTTLIRTIGKLRLEQGIYSLATLAAHDPSKPLQIKAIEAIGEIESSLGISPLQDILHASSESQEIHNAAEQALDQILTRNA